MAEIKIEKKSPIWPWILVLIAVIAIVAYFLFNNDSVYDDERDYDSMDTISNSYEDDYRSTEDTYKSTSPYVDSTIVVQEFTNSITDSTRIGADSTYTKTAIKNLAKVVTMKADQIDLQTSPALENLKEYADNMDNMDNMTNTNMPERTDINKDFKTVSNDIVTVLESIQTKNYPSLQNEIAELKQTSSKIENDVAIKEQQNTIQNFFTKAKMVVNNMNT